MGWDGMGWDGMGWDSMAWHGMGCDGIGWDSMHVVGRPHKTAGNPISHHAQQLSHDILKLFTNIVGKSVVVQGGHCCHSFLFVVRTALQRMTHMMQHCGKFMKSGWVTIRQVFASFSLAKCRRH